MALILPIKGVFPQFGNQNWQAPNATIIGDVQLGDSCTVWFNSVIIGDVNKIRILNKYTKDKLLFKNGLLADLLKDAIDTESDN